MLTALASQNIPGRTARGRFGIWNGISSSNQTKDSFKLIFESCFFNILFLFLNFCFLKEKLSKKKKKSNFKPVDHVLEEVDRRQDGGPEVVRARALPELRAGHHANSFIF
jgi:hypothetical protein